ncbi:MAG: MBL fold metallo-hydrolase [Planctomycetales bacterium]|nr:MBL fold metallo-hydrolase [Planctomycetales bacterium]
MQIESIHIESVLSQPFAENTFIIWRDGQSDCIVVDPGLEPDKILRFLDQNSLTPSAILNTHGHSDHIAGNGVMKEKWPDCPLLIGSGDEDKLSDPDKNLSAPFGLPLTSPPADRTVDQGDVLQLAGISLEVFDTPGHSIGHVVFVCRDLTPLVVVGGDVLFKGSIGRTDFPDGSFQQLRDSIHNVLFRLPADTMVLPGHGPSTTVGQEIETNPFVGKPAGFAL